VGATLYALVEGRSPLDTGSAADEATAAQLLRLVSTPPRQPEHAGPLIDLLGRLLATTPEHRPDAATTAAWLAAIATGQVVGASGASVPGGPQAGAGLEGNAAADLPAAITVLRPQTGVPPHEPSPTVPLPPGGAPTPAGAGIPAGAVSSSGGTPPRSRRPLVIGVAVALFVAAAGGAYMLTRSGSPSSSTPATAAVSATSPTTPGGPQSPATVTVAPPVTVTVAPPVTVTVSAPPTVAGYPAVQLTGQECGRFGTGPFAAAAAGNSATSCPFALNVQAMFTDGPAGTPSTIEVWSPVTSKLYVMTCTGTQPVTCTGGNNAIVYLYGGPATFSG